MKKLLCYCVVLAIAVSAVIIQPLGAIPESQADERNSQTSRKKTAGKPGKAAIARSRKTVKMLDNIFKQTIVLVTDKYVHDEDDFAAGSAAVLLFENISKSGDNKIRLIDATGDPYDTKNVAKDDFEKAGIKRLKAGAAFHEQVVKQNGKTVLRAMTPVPVVMQKCIMCHSHYEDVKKGDPIGAISYTVPVE